MEVYGIFQNQLLKKTKIPPGTKLRLIERKADGTAIVLGTVRVVEEYRHHVLLDFGKYKESRRKVDIAFRIGDVII